jgi:hypothetical protein
MDKLSTNTHAYDKIIGQLYHQYIVVDDKELISQESFQNVLIEITKHINKLKDKQIKKKALHVMQMISRTDDKNNYDSVNNIHVKDLFPRTWRFIKHYDEDGIKIFLEQIAEVTNGSCSQGRTTRIFQFYEYHMLNKGKIYNKVLKVNNTTD